jgi:protein TonB
MQHPEHLIGSTRSGMTPQRVAGLAFVGLIHVAVIYALVMGLMPQVTKIFSGPVIVDFPKTADPKQAPPLDPALIKPTHVDPITPTIVTNPGDDNNTVTTSRPEDNGRMTTFIPDTGVRAVAGTHTIPDYPELARRLGQEGTVEMRLSIAPDGTVVDAAVVQSSGSDMLDQAAIAWVKAHWRYQPATHLGAPVASTAEAAVRFDLRNAR